MSPTDLLGLPREIRQNILLNIITDRDFENDFEFNRILQMLMIFSQNEIFSRIMSYLPTIPKTFPIADPLRELDRVSKSESEPAEDFESARRILSNFRPTLTSTAAMTPEQLVHLGFVPSHVVTLAKKLASIHPILKDDMGWVLQQWLQGSSRRAYGVIRVHTPAMTMSEALLDHNIPKPQFVFRLSEERFGWWHYRFEMWKGLKWAGTLMKFGQEWGGKDWSPARRYGEGWIDSVCDLMGQLPVSPRYTSWNASYRHQVRSFKLVGLGISEHQEEHQYEADDEADDAV